MGPPAVAQRPSEVSHRPGGTLAYSEAPPQAGWGTEALRGGGGPQQADTQNDGAQGAQAEDAEGPRPQLALEGAGGQGAFAV